MLKRTRGYLGRRLSNPIRGQGLRESMGDARETLKVTALDREEAISGYRGRYADGGIAKFEEMRSFSGMNDADLGDLASARIMQFKIMSVMGAAAFVCGLVMIILSDGLMYSLAGLSLGLFSMVFCSIALKHDFSAWQIQKRRFGGFREYMDDRWGDASSGNTQKKITRASKS